MGDNTQNQNDIQQQPNGGERQTPGQQNQQGQDRQNQDRQNQGGQSGERIDTDGDGRTRDPNDTSPTDQGGKA